MVVTHNLMAQNANRQFGIVTNNRAKTTEKLSSGYRINRGADDAAGLAISEKMRWNIRGLNRGKHNIEDGISWVQVGDGAMNEVHDMVHRIRELAIQASNDTNTAFDRQQINHEIANIKKEISSISDKTTFNTKKVFDNSEIQYNIAGVPNDFSIYNATYDDATGNFSWGGFVIDGERIDWEHALGAGAIDATGQFVDGEYDITTASGKTLHISTEAGSDVPNVTRKIKIDADSNYIIIDGVRYDWNKVYDEDGNTMSSADFHYGSWGIDMGDACVISIFIPESVENFNDMVDGIHDNPPVIRYSLEEKYVGNHPEKAVDATIPSPAQPRVSNAFVNNLSSDDPVYTLRVDNAGIWLEDENHRQVGDKILWTNLTDANGNPAGIADWNNGTSANKDKTYHFACDITSGASSRQGTIIEFDFTLSDITSVDSVIDGLDGVKIAAEKIETHYDTNVNVTNSDGIKSSASSTNNFILFKEEKRVGRDFDIAANNNVFIGKGEYTAATHTAKIDIKGDNTTGTAGNNSTAYTFTGNTSLVEQRLENMLRSYADDVIREKTADALQGIDPQRTAFTVSSSARTTANFTLNASEGRVMNLAYDYDFADDMSATDTRTSAKEIIDNITVMMVQDNNGNYFRIGDTGPYTLYDPDAHSALLADPNVTCARYSIQVTENNITASIPSLADKAITRMMKNTAVDIDSTDYTYMHITGDENSNVAIRPDFTAEVVETPRTWENGINIQCSSNEGNYMTIPRFPLNTVELNLFAANTTTYTRSQLTIALCDYALEKVSEKRATYGAMQNRLEHSYNNNYNISENTQAAESRLRDADIAAEMVDYSKHNILTQAGQSMISQANASTQGVLSLLQ